MEALSPTHLTRLDKLPTKFAQQFPDQGALPKPSKFGNRPTEYLAFVYDSKREAAFARDLTLMLRAGQLYDWNQQVKVTFEVLTDGRLVCRSRNPYLKSEPRLGEHAAKKLWSHVIDFLLVHTDGSIELVEVKSSATRTRTWIHNLAMLEATLLRENPKIMYRVEQ